VKPLLRAAIVLLGLQVTLGQLAGLGAGALVLAVLVVALTLPFTIWLGRVLGVEPALAQLIGTGTAICGASAIVAANQVARGRDEDVTYALAVITLCGTAALILFPLLGELMGLSGRAYGLWAGRPSMRWCRRWARRRRAGRMRAVRHRDEAGARLPARPRRGGAGLVGRRAARRMRPG
jgi:uncharacterized integral membrane protein (TIGR00698 family)